MLTLNKTNITGLEYTLEDLLYPITPDLAKVVELKDGNTQEVLSFLKVRPLHTVVMTSFINDNGIESDLNRGKFYGYRGPDGSLEGVALVGHSTLVEARTENALTAFAITARSAETPIHLIMSSGNAATRFWNRYTNGLSQPRLTCTELLFELNYPFMVQNCKWNVRLAKTEELIQIAEAQAEVAEIECGVNPLLKDKEGFLKRVMRRIEQERIFVVFDGDKLVFKADIIAETDDVIYLEGIYAGHDYRGQGVGSSCLALLSLELVSRAENICMLSNVDLVHAHKSFAKAGFKTTDQCTTLFV
ncbi:MAG: GNAT family N-acetyltransferase [Blastocatellia bacterium]